MKMMIPAMLSVHRMNHALFLTAHKKKGPAPPAPPPAPPVMSGYCGEGSTQFATWGYGY